jgi:hypothetical protein
MANPLMTDSSIKSLLHELKDDLERLRADLENEIASIVGVDEYAEDDILTKEDDGSVTIDVAELKSLFERLDDASEAVGDAFREFNQGVDRVWRRFQASACAAQRSGDEPMIVKCHVCNRDPAERWKQPPVCVFIEPELEGEERYRCREHMSPTKEAELKAREKERGFSLDKPQ